MHFLKAPVTPHNIITPNLIVRLFFTAQLEVHCMIVDSGSTHLVSYKFIREKAVQELDASTYSRHALSDLVPGKNNRK